MPQTTEALGECLMHRCRSGVPNHDRAVAQLVSAHELIDRLTFDAKRSSDFALPHAGIQHCLHLNRAFAHRKFTRAGTVWPPTAPCHSSISASAALLAISRTTLWYLARTANSHGL